MRNNINKKANKKANKKTISKNRKHRKLTQKGGASRHPHPISDTYSQNIELLSNRIINVIRNLSNRHIPDFDRLYTDSYLAELNVLLRLGLDYNFYDGYNEIKKQDNMVTHMSSCLGYIEQVFSGGAQDTAKDIIDYIITNFSKFVELYNVPMQKNINYKKNFIIYNLKRIIGTYGMEIGIIQKDYLNYLNYINFFSGQMDTNHDLISIGDQLVRTLLKLEAFYISQQYQHITKEQFNLSLTTAFETIKYAFEQSQQSRYTQ